MKQFLTQSIIGACSLSLLHAQIDQPAPCIEEGAGVGEWDLKWTGKPNRTYFLQHSDDLQNWNYIPSNPMVGDGSEIVVGVIPAADRYFARLTYTDTFGSNSVSELPEGFLVYIWTQICGNTGNPPTGGTDADNDGLPTWAESCLGTSDSNINSDGDRMGDALEILNGRDPSTADDTDEPEEIRTFIAGGNFAIAWTDVYGRAYWIERTQDFANWEPVDLRDDSYVGEGGTSRSYTTARDGFTYRLATRGQAAPQKTVTLGEPFDVSSSGMMLTYAQGSDAANGFGAIYGGTFFNHDENNLYVGVAGFRNEGNNSLVILLDGLDSTQGVTHMNQVGGTTPEQIARANNIQLINGFQAEIAVVVPADKTDSSNGGVYRLRSGAAPQKLSNLSMWGDSSDDSPNGGVEASIPLSELGANAGDNIKAAAYVCGGSDGTNIYLSAEQYGLIVSGLPYTPNDSVNFGFNTVQLDGNYVLLSEEGAPATATHAVFDPQNDVMIQGFYWDVPKNPLDARDGVWYNTLASQVSNFSLFSKIWMPPPSKGHSGRDSVGYDPFDYYDLGNFVSKSPLIDTRYGSESELRTLINTLNSAGIEPIVDLVLNHQNGGFNGSEPRYSFPNSPPFPGSQKFQRFNGFSRGYYHDSNEDLLYPVQDSTGQSIQKGGFPYWTDWGFGLDWTGINLTGKNRNNPPDYADGVHSTDVNHRHPYMAQGLIDWAEWLTNGTVSGAATVSDDTWLLGGSAYGGYRFDLTQAIEPHFTTDFLNQNHSRGRFSVVEFWEEDDNATIDQYATWIELHDRRTAIFDMKLWEHLVDLCSDANASGTSFNVQTLAGDQAGFFRKMPDYAVTFVESHDTIRPTGTDKLGMRRNKELAYAYILMAEGMPMVFYHDYLLQPYRSTTDNVFTGAPLKSLIDPLINARRSYASGSTTFYTPTSFSSDLLVMKREGTAANNDGCILALNDSTAIRTSSVQTGYPSGTVLLDVIDGTTSVTVNASGVASISIPARSYRVYVPQ